LMLKMIFTNTVWNSVLIEAAILFGHVFAGFL